MNIKMKSTIHILWSKRFAPLLITQFTTAFCDNLFKVAFITYVIFDPKWTYYEDGKISSLAATLFILPFILFSGQAGQLADKFDKTYVCIITKISEFFIFALGCYYIYTINIYGALLIIFLSGTQSAFFSPVKYSLPRVHLKKNELLFANGCLEATTFTSILLGSVTAIILYAHSNFTVISCTLLGVSTLGTICAFFIPKTGRAEPNIKISYSPFKSNFQNVHNSFNSQYITFSILGISWFWLIGNIFLTLLPAYTKTILNGSQDTTGIALLTFTIGICIGSLSCNFILKGKTSTKLLKPSLIAFSIALVAFVVVSHNIAPLLQKTISNNMNEIALLFSSNVSSVLFQICLMLLGIFASIFVVPLYTLLQIHAKAEDTARHVASNNFINSVFIVAGGIWTYLLFYIGLRVDLVMLTLTILSLLVAIGINRISLLKLPTQ